MLYMQPFALPFVSKAEEAGESIFRMIEDNFLDPDGPDGPDGPGGRQRRQQERPEHMDEPPPPPMGPGFNPFGFMFGVPRRRAVYRRYY